MIYSTVEPLRRFQIDDKFKLKLEKLRSQYEANSSNLDLDRVLLRGFGLPLNIPLHLVKNFHDLQKMLYKCNDSLSKELHFMEFWYKSRQIFQFDTNLSEALYNTDINEIPWEKILLPFDDMYVSFGNPNNDSFEIKGTGYRYVVDGAYLKLIKPNESLIFRDGAFMINFTSKLIEPDYQTAIEDKIPGMLFNEPTYEFILSGKNGETVIESIRKGEENFLKQCDRMDQMNYEQSLSLSKELEISTQDNIKLDLFRQKYLRGKENIYSSLAILFNCIFYLTQYPKNITSVYDNHKSKILFKKLSRAKDNPTETDKLNKEIVKNDYTRIKFVSDKNIKANYQINSGREVKSHWRRGHWRNQAFGDNLSNHKFIWICPTIVNKRKGSPESGHIYEVNQISDTTDLKIG